MSISPSVLAPDHLHAFIDAFDRLAAKYGFVRHGEVSFRITRNEHNPFRPGDPVYAGVGTNLTEIEMGFAYRVSEVKHVP